MAWSQWSTAGTVADPATFVKGLQNVITAHDILRSKGFVDVAGNPILLQMQAVGARTDLYSARI